jgi:hypothetical protein
MADKTNDNTSQSTPEVRQLLKRVVTDAEIQSCRIPDSSLKINWFTCSERVWGKRCGVIAHYNVEDRKFGKKYVCYHHCSTWLRDNKKRLSE